MSELASEFQSIPPEYQHVIQLAQERHRIRVTPLQELVGGWSGAMVFLVSVAYQDSPRVEHFVLKLDRKRKKTRSDEIDRHNRARSLSPKTFADHHIPEIHFGRVDSEEAIAIFYAIAGQSLREFRPLSKFQQQSHLETIFRETYRYFLTEWNAGPVFRQALHPQTLLKDWLGFRLNPGGNTETFMREACQVDPEGTGFLIRGRVFPNPLLYARYEEPWGGVRPGDAIYGLHHGDLNTNNILVKFTRGGDELDGFFLIDFALFKEDLPLLYDLRYLEMSYLLLTMSQASLGGCVDLIVQLGEADILEPHRAPIEMAGPAAVIRTGRLTFDEWVRKEHPTLQDDLWGQYWLAGVAAGLGYAHKAATADEQRLAGLIYAAANLKRYAALFGLPVPAEARQLYDEARFDQAARAGSPVDSPGSPSGRIPHNLPAQPTTFIGREAQVADIIDLLSQPDVRLVTLTGPGGTGKTRVGLEIARSVMEQFPNGVYFVDLSPIRDPSLVASTIAHTLGIREGGGRPPLENLVDYLQNKQVLLLLDNFEQVTQAVQQVAELLAAAPSVKALVTSRIPLLLRGEHEYPISPLSLPMGECQAEADVLEYEAVALFQQRAQSVQPSFEITADNCPAVIEICRRLDGLPLAIEIAAARIKLLPPQAMLKRLDESLKLLVAGARDLPDRQQTLRRTIDWSYELLEPEVQTLFSRLGIFSGGFTLEAAEGVGSPGGEIDVFSGIETLLNNSLLRRVESVMDEPRLDLLQTIRDYALEKAEETGILAELQRAHCEYYSGLGVDFGKGIFGAESIFWLKRMNEEHDNYRIALEWGLSHEDTIPMVLPMIIPLTWFWFRFGHMQVGQKLTDLALEATQGMGDSPPRIFALIASAFISLWTADLNIAVERARKAVEICERLRFDMGLSFAKLGLGVALINQGRDKEAYSHLVDVVELFDEREEVWNKGTALVHLANVSLGLGDTDQALQWLDMAMPFMEASGDIWNMAFGYNNYGEVARALGEYDKAEEYYRRTEDLYKQADARGDQARLVHTFGYIAMHKGDYEQAEALFRESLEDFRELGNHRGIAECLAGLAVLASERGRHTWAVPLLSGAERQLKAFGGDWWPADRVEIERTQNRMLSTLGDEYDVLWERGQTMTLDKVIEYISVRS